MTALQRHQWYSQHMPEILVTIIFVNAGSGDDRAARIAPNVFGNNLRVTPIRFGMESTVADTTLRDEAVDMGVLFKITPEGMENTEKTRGKAFGFIVFVEHTEDDIADSGEEAAKEGTVSEEKGRSYSAMVKTQWRCLMFKILKDMEVVRSMEYFVPQVGQKRLWQRKGTNLSSPHLSQAYMAPPKEGSPQLSIRSTFQVTDWRVWRI